MKTSLKLFVSICVLSNGIAMSAMAQVPEGKNKVGPTETLRDKADQEVMRRRADTLSIPYNELHKLYRDHDPILYISILPQFNPLKGRQTSLQDGEGKDGYWAEGNIAHRISLYRGKYYSPGFLKKLRATFDAGFMIRMTRDNSSPLLPTSDNVGLGFDYLVTPVANVVQPNTKNLWVKLQVHHYSNGQAGSFFLNNTPGRNNYKNGDFSTNYFRVVFNGLTRTLNDHLLSAGLGYQREINIGGPLTLSDEFKDAYGLNRLLLNLQWIRASQFRLLQKEKGSTIKTTRTQMSFRTELTYVMDQNLSRYPLAQKYRLAGHAYFTWMPWVTSDVGFVTHAFLGRDYLNIRYDDAVFSWQFGLVMNFNK